MIAKLRRRHRIAAYGFWLLLPLAFYLASATNPVPKMAELPVELQKGSPSDERVNWQTLNRSTSIGIVREGPGAGALALQIHSRLRRPDVLVYWLAEEPAEGEGVPEGAILTGRLDGTRPVSLAMPATDRGGLLVFSLGHQERLGWVPLEKLRVAE